MAQSMSLKLRRGNRELIKDLNRSLVVEQIRQNGPISRTDISKRTELGLSTITNIVDTLLEDSIVEEVGSGISNGGRKPVLLKLNGKHGVVICIKIEPAQVVLAVSDLDIKLSRQKYLPLSKEISNQQFLTLLIKQIGIVLDSFEKEQLLYGIGIAISGLIDRSKKKLVHSPILGWRHVDFRELEAHFKAPVYVDNDANVFTLAHMWSGVGQAYSHFIGVTLGEGIGAGIVIDNKLYRGNIGGAGELGHTVIQREGILCHCGQRGCLEMYASDNYLIKEVLERNSHQLTSSIGLSNSNSIDEIYAAAQKDDKTIQQLLVKQGENLGQGLKNLVNLLNPAAIILGGTGIRGMPYVGEGIHKQLDSHFFSGQDNALNVHVSDLGNDAWLIGSCALVLDDVFKAPIYE